jgi:Domain of unknown function (DUF3303)
MLYMVIERFKPGAATEIYRRLREGGRHLVDGLEYVASWVDFDFAACWQIMSTDDRALLETWCAAGRELVDFEIVPVRTSAEAAAVMAAHGTSMSLPIQPLQSDGGSPRG